MMFVHCSFTARKCLNVFDLLNHRTSSFIFKTVSNTAQAQAQTLSSRSHRYFPSLGDRCCQISGRKALQRACRGRRQCLHIVIIINDTIFIMTIIIDTIFIIIVNNMIFIIMIMLNVRLSKEYVEWEGNACTMCTLLSSLSSLTWSSSWSSSSLTRSSSWSSSTWSSSSWSCWMWYPHRTRGREGLPAQRRNSEQ